MEYQFFPPLGFVLTARSNAPGRMNAHALGSIASPPALSLSPLVPEAGAGTKNLDFPN